MLPPMAQAQALLTPLPVDTSITPGSLRAEMESRRAAGRRFDVREVIGLAVPLCTQLHHLHEQGKTLFVHPSSLGYAPGSGVRVLEEHAHTPPTLPRDRACLAPEERKGGEGDARASVFAIGAILYELITNSSIGPGMRRPAELIPDLPPALEVVIGKSLVADPRHRPADLAALAQALHHIAPTASEAPPPADESHLDADGEFEVDVALSMMPPTDPGAHSASIPSAPSVPRFQAVAGDGPFAIAIPTAQQPALRSDDPTRKLADLKAALESDTRPRYVVVKDGMDHGPFSSVELLQQVASGSFVGDHTLRDTFSGDERAIQDWEEFAPFAEQAKLNRDIVQEKRALEAVVTAEKKGTQYKALVGLAVMGVISAAGVGTWYRERNSKERELAVRGANERIAIEVDAGLGKAAKSGGGSGGTRPAGGGSYPTLSGGLSCEGAQARYVEEYKIGNSGPPDLTAGAYGAVLNRGSYLNACNVPSNMEVNICAAVQNGRAVGVTVTTSPQNGGVASCVAGQVRGLPFPSNPRLDVARTTFAASN
jgi:eukaryotic-like serine/threonine-protein kinase